MDSDVDCVAIGYINGCQGEDYTGTGAYIQSAKERLGTVEQVNYATIKVVVEVHMLANGYIQGSCTPGIGCTVIFGSSGLSVLFFGGAAGVGYAGPA